VRLRKREEARIKVLTKALEKPKKKETVDKKEVWSVKVSTIRDRLTGKKRTSEERWNRFAGTESGGGRGR
jgi:hypothetical protein